MSNREFVAVSWTGGQLIDEDSMDQFNSNTIFLREQMVDGKYMMLDGGVVDVGLKLLCGRKAITPRKSDTATISIGFASMFTPGMTPIVTTSLTSPGFVKLFHIINGPGGAAQPTHQGFQCRVNVDAETEKNDSFNAIDQGNVIVNWIAMGY